MYRLLCLPLLLIACSLLLPSHALEVCDWDTPPNCPAPSNWGNANDRSCLGRINYWRKRACDENWVECPSEGLPPMAECTACHRCANSQAVFDKQEGSHESFARCSEFAQGVGGGADDCAELIDMFASERKRASDGVVRCQGHCGALVKPGCQTFHWGTDGLGFYVINYRGCNANTCQDYCDDPSENECFGIEPTCRTASGQGFIPTVCFSGDSIVETKTNGMIKLSEAKVGDMIKVAHDRYEPIYSFGHYDPDQSAEMLVINSNLELSHDHLIHVQSQGFVPASSLKVGNHILTDSGESLEAHTISSTLVKGVYAPFTLSGTIVVSGYVASSYVTLQPESSTLTMFGFSTGLTWHWIAHSFELPHRLCYYLGYCKTDEYTKEGYSTWVARPHRFGRWILKQNPILRMVFLFPIMLVLLLLACLENMSVLLMGLVAWLR